MSNLTYWLALTASCGFCFRGLYLVLRKLQVLSILFLPLGIGLVSAGFGAFVLDHGAYVSELGAVTWNSWSAPLFFLVLAVLCYLIGAFCWLLRLGVRREGGTDCLGQWIEGKLFEACGYLAVLYLLMDMKLSAVPLFSGGAVTRFNYWSSVSVLPGAEQVSNLLTVISYALAFSMASRRVEGRQSFGVVPVLALFIGTRFLLGYRVSGIVDLVTAAFFGYYSRSFACQPHRERSGEKVIVIGVVLSLVSAGSYLLWSVSSGSAASFSEAWDAMVDRKAALANHLWWAVCADGPVVRSVGVRDTAELGSVFTGNTEFSLDSGVYGLMHTYGEPGIVGWYAQEGVRFASNFFAVSLFYNGWLVTLAFIVWNALVLAAFLRAFSTCAKEGAVLAGALLYRVFTVFSSYLNGSGTLVTFYRPNVVVLLILVALVFLVEGTVSRRASPSVVSGRKMAIVGSAATRARSGW